MYCFMYCTTAALAVCSGARRDKLTFDEEPICPVVVVVYTNFETSLSIYQQLPGLTAWKNDTTYCMYVSGCISCQFGIRYSEYNSYIIVLHSLHTMSKLSSYLLKYRRASASNSPSNIFVWGMGNSPNADFTSNGEWGMKIAIFLDIPRNSSFPKK